MSKLIIVAGMPGVGKTTLAKELSQKLNIPCLHKDSIKEKLYDSFGGNSLEDSKNIGGWVYDENPNYELMPDKKINITTDQPVEILIEKILKEINNSSF